jgi:hypothetical protein
LGVAGVVSQVTVVELAVGSLGIASVVFETDDIRTADRAERGRRKESAGGDAERARHSSQKHGGTLRWKKRWQLESASTQEAGK